MLKYHKANSKNHSSCYNVISVNNIYNSDGYQHIKTHKTKTSTKQFASTDHKKEVTSLHDLQTCSLANAFIFTQFTATLVRKHKTPYKIFICDTQNENSGSFLSIPYLELSGSERIQCERLELLHCNHSDPTSMLPSSCRNNQECTGDISLLQDVRFSQQRC